MNNEKTIKERIRKESDKIQFLKELGKILIENNDFEKAQSVIAQRIKEIPQIKSLMLKDNGVIYILCSMMANIQSYEQISKIEYLINEFYPLSQSDDWGLARLFRYRLFMHMKFLNQCGITKIEKNICNLVDKKFLPSNYINNFQAYRISGL